MTRCATYRKKYALKQSTASNCRISSFVFFFFFVVEIFFFASFLATYDDVVLPKFHQKVQLVQKTVDNVSKPFCFQCKLQFSIHWNLKNNADTNPESGQIIMTIGTKNEKFLKICTNHCIVARQGRLMYFEFARILGKKPPKKS